MSQIGKGEKMIDWVTARLPCTNTGDICDGKVIKNKCR